MTLSIENLGCAEFHFSLSCYILMTKTETVLITFNQEKIGQEAKSSKVLADNSTKTSVLQIWHYL